MPGSGFISGGLMVAIAVTTSICVVPALFSMIMFGTSTWAGVPLVSSLSVNKLRAVLKLTWFSKLTGSSGLIIFRSASLRMVADKVQHSLSSSFLKYDSIL